MADLTVIEVKAGRTPAADYFSAFPVFAERLAQRKDQRWRLARRLVVYGGDLSQSRNVGELVSWQDLPELEVVR